MGSLDFLIGILMKRIWENKFCTDEKNDILLPRYWWKIRGSGEVYKHTVLIHVLYTGVFENWRRYYLIFQKWSRIPRNSHDNRIGLGLSCMIQYKDMIHYQYSVIKIMFVNEWKDWFKIKNEDDRGSVVKTHIMT